MESLFKRGIKKECEKVGGMFRLMKQLDRSHALILSNCFVGKEKKIKTRRGGKQEKNRGQSWRSTSETCCDCSYNARLTHLEMHGSEGTELCCASSHSAQCR